MTVTFTLPITYGWVVLSAISLCFQCFVIGFLTMGSRKKYFNKDFLVKNFGDEHKKEIGRPLPEFGYPDHGNGRFSQKLSYKGWFEINNAMRVHQNYLETIGILIPAVLIAGLSFPIGAAILGAFHFIGRVCYSIGYMTEEGSNNRRVGALLAHGSTVIILAMGFISAFNLIKLV